MSAGIAALNEVEPGLDQARGELDEVIERAWAAMAPADVRGGVGGGPPPVSWRGLTSKIVERTPAAGSPRMTHPPPERQRT